MLLYISIFFIVVLVNYLTKLFRLRKENGLLFSFLILAVFIGLGDMIGGYDRYVYGSSFDYIADETRTGQGYQTMLFLVSGSEYGFFAWQFLIAQLTSNRYIFIFLTTIFIYILYFNAFRLYIEDYPWALILFLGLLYYFTMTYLRQVIAVGIAWQGVKFIWERKPLIFFVILLLAYSFHNSVLIFAPMYFLPLRKYSQKTILLFLGFAFLIGMTPLPNMLMENSGEFSGMASRTADYAEQNQGFRIEYVLEVVFFVWILFKHYDRIGHSRKTLTFLNMCFLFCAMLLSFMRFGQGGRFSWYYMFGIIYMLSTLCKVKYRYVWMRPLTFLISFTFFLRITYVWLPMNAPYKTFLTDGEPAGNGIIYKIYEYDFGYTNDKFYRK
ncbi:hypothetical protein CTM53_01035 [Prevotella intermedia]|uniref:EpsG family protein n=1 Tax=Prevotella intermedia TaxID=28131 RepID=A0AAJ3VDE3_PREIN|nr:EpsG family protein [Prevotella intermedia]ATV55509.1 EpsG family protein [Prevotella intermedia]PJI19527.1 hypothetical protein CTM53_01035 [Prevotella intermedia]